MIYHLIRLIFDLIPYVVTVVASLCCMVWLIRRYITLCRRDREKAEE